jgi:hypothetical protein
MNLQNEAHNQNFDQSPNLLSLSQYDNLLGKEDEQDIHDGFFNNPQDLANGSSMLQRQQYGGDAKRTPTASRAQYEPPQQYLLDTQENLPSSSASTH